MVQILFIQSYLYMFFHINRDMTKYSISNKNNKLGHPEEQEKKAHIFRLSLLSITFNLSN